MAAVRKHAMIVACSEPSTNHQISTLKNTELASLSSISCVQCILGVGQPAPSCAEFANSGSFFPLMASRLRGASSVVDDDGGWFYVLLRSRPMAQLCSSNGADDALCF